MTDVRITYIGGPTALIEIGDWRLLTDPTFDPPGKRYFFGWGTYSRKLQGPAIEFADLGRIDAVLISHDHHGDNLDPSGRSLLPQMGTIITTAPGARRLGGDARGLEPWAATTLTAEGRVPIEITATPCRHGPPGSKPIVGTVTGFSLRWEGQEHGALWITGDTVLYEGVREVANRMDVGTAIVHMGGVTFWWLSGPLKYTMTAKDALELCELVKPHAIVPIHYEGWRHFTQRKNEAEKVLSGSSLARSVHWLEAGSPTELSV
ncbi:MAG TPA: MBL fold metallo-hydrolase [Solirubrobacteraceae bacterium]|nr:MBL fold metallo-hydrolase [Solirubrobacteraceae bacterium]